MQPYLGPRLEVEFSSTVSLTAGFYLCYGGHCSRVGLELRGGRWFLDEWPYDPDALIPCDRAGQHPHKGPAPCLCRATI